MYFGYGTGIFKAWLTADQSRFIGSFHTDEKSSYGLGFGEMVKEVVHDGQEGSRGSVCPLLFITVCLRRGERASQLFCFRLSLTLQRDVIKVTAMKTETITKDRIL